MFRRQHHNDILAALRVLGDDLLLRTACMAAMAMELARAGEIQVPLGTPLSPEA